MEKNSPKSEIDFNSEVTYGIVRKKRKGHQRNEKYAKYIRIYNNRSRKTRVWYTVHMYSLV